MNCPHCHSAILAGSTTCPDCGASLSLGEVKDDGIYPELAKANVMRMRGDSRGAEMLLLSLLKKYPNNASAHEMLGDIHLEADDMNQAAQWYELALDLAPDTPGLAEKMLRAKNSIVEEEERKTVEQIGLQPPASNRLLAASMAAVVVLALVILGLLAILNRNATPVVIRSVISAPPELTLVGNPSLVPTPQPTHATPTPEPSATPPVVQDQAALTFLSQHAADGSRLLALTTDPRGESMALTFSVTQGEDPKPIAARLAKSAFDQYAACAAVTVRASLDGNLVYVADASRARLQETQTTAWQEANAGADSWIAYLLTNEWKVGESPRPSAPASPTESATSPGSIVPVSPP